MPIIGQTFTGETRAKLLHLVRRSRQTITALADALRLTDNAVRTHVTALERDGLVECVGTERDTGGKPARLYALTAEGEELFPKAYAVVLEGLIEEIARKDGPERAIELLQSVGRQAAAVAAVTGDPDARVATAAAALRDLGGDVDMQRTADGWHLQAYGCPLSAVTAKHPEVCTLAKALVEEITGLPVTECCERSDGPRCAFRIHEEPHAQLQGSRMATQ